MPKCHNSRTGQLPGVTVEQGGIGEEDKIDGATGQDVKDQAEQLAAMTATAAYLGVSDTLGAEPGLEEAKKARQAESEGRWVVS